jgi:hypothetical protein
MDMNDQLTKLLQKIENTMFLQRRTLVKESELRANLQICSLELMKIEQRLQQQYREMKGLLKSES